MGMSSKGDGRRSSIGYVLEAAAAIAFIYFLLGGSRWSAAIWAAFAVVAVWIVVMNVRRDAGLETEATYSRWKLQLGFLMVLAMLAGALWHGSLWLLGLGAILGWFWTDDYRSHRSMIRGRLKRLRTLPGERRDDRPDHTP